MKKAEEMDTYDLLQELIYTHEILSKISDLKPSTDYIGGKLKKYFDKHAEETRHQIALLRELYIKRQNYETNIGIHEN